ncbi:hypothetical protein [Halobaculum lipolyticum]|uniref:DUF7973 domain-containing protein n=1 Tax=Halobaculum lipolyticum TaxID=3032001 RepID=A0ABD5WAV4_9EURY|nr:hypothetical protein [Halobaculum sp. DT31]
MPLADLLALELLIAAFAGGAFGAALGALNTFVLCGFTVIAGELYALATRAAGGTVPVNVTGDVAFGVVLGPHVAFGGGAAALAYAVSKGYVETPGFDYHPAKEVTVGLGSRPDVLAVGGAFGVLGFAVATASGSLGVPTDPVALGVVVSALAHRAAFGYSLVGAPLSKLLDMTPFERGEGLTGLPGRPAVGDGGDEADSAEAVADGGTRTAAATPPRVRDGADDRTRVEPWLPYLYRWRDVVGLGAVVGVLSGYVAYLTGSAFLAFGISVAALVFLVGGTARIPVTHHMALPASTVVLALAGAERGTVLPGVVAGDVSMSVALLVAGAFGVFGALAGELLQRVFFAHSETHLDPPAASIVVSSLVIGVLAWLGVVPASAWIPLG